jgi:hypothetical protein
MHASAFKIELLAVLEWCCFRLCEFLTIIGTKNFAADSITFLAAYAT